MWTRVCASRVDSAADSQAQQHRAGRLTSCHVVELDFLIDGHVIAGRSV